MCVEGTHPQRFGMSRRIIHASVRLAIVVLLFGKCEITSAQAQPAVGDISIVNGANKDVIAESPIRIAAFAPSGKQLALGTATGTIEIWDIVKTRRLRNWKAHRLAVQSLSFSPDGGTLASEGRDRRLTLWNSMNGKEIWSVTDPTGSEVLAEPDAANSRIAFSGDGTRIASFGFLWDVAAGKQLDRYGFRGPVAIRSNWLASTSKSGMHLVDMKDMSESFAVKEDALHGVDISADGKMIVVGRALYGAGAQVKQLPDGKLVGRILPRSWIYGAEFSPDSKHLAISGRMPAVHVFDTQQLKEELRLETAGVENYWVGFSPDGKFLAAVGTNETVRLWTFPEGKSLNK